MKKLLTITLMTIMALLTSCKDTENLENELNKKGSYVEVVIWKPKAGYSDKEVNERAIKMNDFLKEQDGFLYREFAENDKGERIDFVYWDTKENAEKAQVASQTSKSCAPAFEAIDMNNMQMNHFRSVKKYFKK